jgi:hypothetical protein
MPTGLRDARAASGFTIQGGVGYRRDAQKNDTFGVAPQIQYGRSNWHAEITYLLTAGEGDRRNAGDIHVLLFHQLNGENGRLPTFAVLAGADIPTGIKSAGLDTRLLANASKTIGSGAAGHRVHLNAGWFHNAGRRSDERSSRYRIAAGYSRKLGPSAMVIADYFRQQQRERGEDVSLLELGFRIRVARNTVFAIGAGAGLRSPAARLQAVIGLEQSF